MATYLLAWSSKRWQWENLADMAHDVKAGKRVSMRWSCGRNKRIQKGDRIFLIRLGDNPKGIFASGVIIKGSYEDRHWDKELARIGKRTFFVETQLDTLLDPDADRILSRELLEASQFSKMHWDIQMSGVPIEDKVAKELENLWRNYANADEFDNFNVVKYKTALTKIDMAKFDMAMLRAHYEATNYDTTATKLARDVDLPNFESVNLMYGTLAGKFLKYFQIRKTNFDNLFVLVKLYVLNGEWHWILRPQVVKALDELRWFIPSIPEELWQQEPSDSNLKETERESIVQSRIGQVQFRDSLVVYWQGCSVTGCKQIEVLRASHIKPWRRSSNQERLDVHNGLLLVPNLDACFDSGLISFDERGKILISSALNKTNCALLGINLKLRLLRVEKKHLAFLDYHRKNVFQP